MYNIVRAQIRQKFALILHPLVGADPVGEAIPENYLLMEKNHCMVGVELVDLFDLHPLCKGVDG